MTCHCISGMQLHLYKKSHVLFYPDQGNRLNEAAVLRNSPAPGAQDNSLMGKDIRQVFPSPTA
jgi:hypothetical protein